eukprot:TRINITY_DN15098_c0_g1_i1.p2 TRINITY_DN15098_c0_g1~~TRINITY_DN15098_c0_g1_i1.p2  ORF type:complete len:212 (+),score=79.73 TRINITY_DN15098_c0_g1_i1:32-637(+)
MGHLLPWAALLALVLCVSSSSLGIKIDANKEECFYDDALAGQRIFFAYQVTQGGGLDIDVTVTSPNDSLVFTEERESGGRLLFRALEAGTHKFCFSNRMSTLTAKSIVFQIVAGDPAEKKRKKPGATAVVERSLLRINEALDEIRNEQSYLRTRERVHRDTAESTNDRVKWGSIAQCGAMVGLSLVQAVYLRRGFEKKRSV